MHGSAGRVTRRVELFLLLRALLRRLRLRLGGAVVPRPLLLPQTLALVVFVERPLAAQLSADSVGTQGRIASRRYLIKMVKGVKSLPRADRTRDFRVSTLRRR